MLPKRNIIFALVLVQFLLNIECRSHGNENGNGNNRRNGRWQGIEIVGECWNQTNFEQCYNCGRDADSTEIYSSCCLRVPEIVEICEGNFSDE